MFLVAVATPFASLHSLVITDPDIITGKFQEIEKSRM